jgi:hypothetical protein
VYSVCIVCIVCLSYQVGSSVKAVFDIDIVCQGKTKLLHLQGSLVLRRYCIPSPGVVKVIVCRRDRVLQREGQCVKACVGGRGVYV